MLFIYTIIASLFAVAGIAIAAYLFGANQALGYLIVEGKRREKRYMRETQTWQGKFLERSGLGGLHRRPAPVDTNKPPTRVITSPAQVINDLKAELSTGVPKVPPSIKQSFLEDAGSSLSN